MKFLKAALAVSLIFFSFSLMAQDIIIKNNGDKIKCKVEKVTKSAVEYREYSNLSGPQQNIDRSEVFSIHYENGDIDDLTGEPSKKTKSSSSSDIKRSVFNIGYARTYDYENEFHTQGIEFSFERISKNGRVGFRIPVLAMFADGTDGWADGVQTVHLGFNPKFYLSRGAARFFIGPIVMGGYFLDQEIFMARGGADLGIAIYPTKGFNITLHAGGAYVYVFEDFIDGYVDLLGGVSVGFAF